MTGVDVDEVRRALGPVGAFLGVAPAAAPDVVVQRDAVRRVEAAGWNAIWTNEIIGADALVRSALWLGATARIVVGTCIANVWARPAPTAHAAASQLAQAHPRRFVLGLGVGNPGQAAAVDRGFGSAVDVAGEYLAGLAERRYPAILAANGPQLFAVAASRADGALPAGGPPERTASIRSALGPEQLLVVYAPITPSATPDWVAASVAAHRSAGADHVVVGQSFDTPFAAAVELLLGLAPGAGDA